MKSATHTSMAERFGQALGRTYNRLRRQEARTVGWLAHKGLPVPVGKASLWAMKLLVMAALLYAAFWLALLLVFAIAVVWGAGNAAWEDEEPQSEWRIGPSGYGLYRGDIRIDIGDPYDDE